MFKMNPEAKEFIPAHILKKRQEEASRVSELTKQLDQVDINSAKDEISTTKPASTASERTIETTGPVKDVCDKDTSDRGKTHGVANTETVGSCKLESGDSNERNHVRVNKSNGHAQGGHRDELQDLIDEEEDRYLLNAGENICEFNGEQFIIPGDDDYEPPQPTGYDFGNAEDNEDEDVCNAFEEFLENLPDQ